MSELINCTQCRASKRALHSCILVMKFDTVVYVILYRSNLLLEFLLSGGRRVRRLVMLAVRWLRRPAINLNPIRRDQHCCVTSVRPDGPRAPELITADKLSINYRYKIRR